ncbi:MAG: hypothetical protein AB7E08_03915 [Candidatus Omnitrophota bacterium]
MVERRGIFLILLTIFVLSGCGKGKFSLQDGSAKFSIPFELPAEEK